MIELKDTVISMNRFINIETIDKNIKRKSGGGKMIRDEATDDGKMVIAILQLAYSNFTRKIIEMRSKDKSTKCLLLIPDGSTSEGIARFHKRIDFINIEGNQFR